MSVTQAEQATPQKSKLRLTSLEIRNFRAFDHLQIERLGRVNLITGRNNVGKTSLLEAVYLYSHNGAALPLWEILSARDEFGFQSLGDVQVTGWARSREAQPPIYPLTIRHLFHGRKDFNDFPEAISIGPSNEPAAALRVAAQHGQIQRLETPDGLKSYQFTPVGPLELLAGIDASPYLTVNTGNGPAVHYDLDQLSDRRSYLL